jgi:signal transduction histidine kinase
VGKASALRTVTNTADGIRSIASPATRGRRRLLVLCYSLIVVIVVLDWVTPAGVVVGLLLSIPIVLISMLGRPRPVLAAIAVSLAGFAIAAALGTAPVSPPSVWVPNRILAVFGIVASGAVALMVQRHRRMADDAVRAALSARDTNRLLMSLMAHDLRAPLVAASQVLEYVERSTAAATPLDSELVGDTRLRLRRNLRVIEQVLQVARGDMEEPETLAKHPHVRVSAAQEIEREAASFAGEAEARGKRIVVRTEALASVEMGVEALVLRQVLAILLDNAIRYARPGPLCIDTELTGDTVRVSVTDNGPGLSARPTAAAGPPGAGIGLELCRTLAARAGGSLRLEQDSEHGTRFCLRLPYVAPAPHAADESAAAFASRLVHGATNWDGLNSWLNEEPLGLGGLGYGRYENVARTEVSYERDAHTRGGNDATAQEDLQRRIRMALTHHDSDHGACT